MAKATIVKDQPETTALINWEAELARQAEIASAMEANAGGGNFFSLHAGVLSLNDQAMPDNQIACVILDSVLENAWYEDTDFDPNNRVPPTCFALGRDDATLAPHETVIAAGQAQHDRCKGCPKNEFGSAERGRGKACGNRRRLALLGAGHWVNGKLTLEDAEHFDVAAPAFLRLPPTSIRGYATYVKSVAGAHRRPLHGVFTKIKVVPDTKTMFQVTFTLLDLVPNALLGALMRRHAEVKPQIELPYQLVTEDATPEPPPGRKPAGPKKKAKF